MSAILMTLGDSAGHFSC